MFWGRALLFINHDFMRQGLENRRAPLLTSNSWNCFFGVQPLELSEALCFEHFICHFLEYWKKRQYSNPEIKVQQTGLVKLAKSRLSYRHDIFCAPDVIRLMNWTMSLLLYFSSFPNTNCAELDNRVQQCPLCVSCLLYCRVVGLPATDDSFIEHFVQTSDNKKMSLIGPAKYLSAIPGLTRESALNLLVTSRPTK